MQEIEEQIKRRLYGQELAVDRLMPWIKRLRFGLFRDDKPAAVFLFIGQSGVGKYLLARELARIVCGDEDSLIHIEMGEFRSKESAAIFIGAPVGYVGYGEGKLVNALRDLPESVVLLDEVQMANDQVFDIVLRFIDSGVVQDAAGPIRDGRRAVVILATNAGSNVPSKSELHEDHVAMIDQMIEAAKKVLPLELFARVDEVICFVPFSKDACRKLIDSAIEREIVRLRETKKKINLSVSEPVRVLMAQKFFETNRNDGARAAPRVVNRFLTVPIIDLAFAKGLQENEARPWDLEALVDSEGRVVIAVKE